MFVQIVVKDTIKILPSQFEKNYPDALIDQIHAKYANKVIPNVGLCVCVYELESYGDALLYPGDAATHTSCTFRLVVFRPFKNEILQGKLSDQDSTGLVVSVGFFIDIFVPASDMLPDSEYNEKEQTWVWKYEDSEVFYESGQDIQVRVLHIEYAPNRNVVTKPGEVLQGSAPKTFAALIPPMRVYATINDSGLGLTRWWSAPAEGMEGDVDMVAEAADDEELEAEAAAVEEPESALEYAEPIVEEVWEEPPPEEDDDLVANERGGGDDDAIGDGDYS